MPYFKFCPFYTQINILRNYEKRNFNFFIYFSQSSNALEMEDVAKHRKIIQFVVRLCSDVFSDVICWGNRRQLIEFEKIGRRLHWIIDGRFKRVPFHCLDLYIKPRYLFSLKFLEIQIIYFSRLIRLSGKTISRADFLSIPAFIHFNTVEIRYLF